MLFQRPVTQPKQTSQRRRKNVLILVSKTSQISLKWKSRRPFFKTSSRHLPGDVLKTSSRGHSQDVFQETSSRRLPGHVLKMSSRRRPQGLLKTSQDFKTYKGPPADYMNFLSGYVSDYLHITTPSLDKQKTIYILPLHH